jgi:teichuronic acid biosynthesis glycosyltransferase TuaG
MSKKYLSKKKPSVDIIMPNYNKGLFLSEAINSVIKQSYHNWKLFVIDDASQDNSKIILKKYKKKYKKIKPIYLKKRKSAAFVRNLGIKLSKAHYIAFLDSDDYWAKNKLSNQINFMRKFNYNFTYTDYIPFFLKNNKKIFKKAVSPPNSYTHNQFIYDTSIATSSMIIKKSIIGKIKFTNTQILEDYPFKYKILKTRSKANKLKKNLMFYRISKNSLQSNKLRNIYWLWYINKKYNKFSILKNIMSIFMISISSIKKYGIK